MNKITSVMKRPVCPSCDFPVTTCVCSYLSQPLNNHIEVVILQHPSETKVAKNTAKLLTLQLQHIQLVVGETAADFSAVQSYLANRKAALLYPNKHAQTLAAGAAEKLELDTIIILDGTWKKATRLYQTNLWLHALPSFSFDTHDQSKYTIRKSKHQFSLSTLEACARFLALVEGCDINPLLTLQQGMVEQQMKYMTPEVRERYQNK